jgi:transcriptional regulator with XRE-family HTH domain
MARTKRDNAEAQPEMKRLAIEFSTFREQNNLSQKLLAEIIGVSRRTIQSLEAATIIPHAATLKKFNELRDKYASEAKLSGRKKNRVA